MPPNQPLQPTSAFSTHMTTSPPLNEFLECARREYRFLIDEFGFSEATQSQNPFEVDYTSASLLVAVEGINNHAAANRHEPLYAPLMKLTSLGR